MRIFGVGPLEPLPAPVPQGDQTSKLCPGTSERIAHTEISDKFSKDKARGDGLCVYCRECAAWRQRQWKRNNPEKVKAAKALYRKSGPALA